MQTGRMARDPCRDPPCEYRLCDTHGELRDYRYLPLDPHGMPLQVWQIATDNEMEQTAEQMGASCSVTGKWFNPKNGIYVDMKQSGKTFTASCEGPVGWKDATGTVSAPATCPLPPCSQGTVVLHTGKEVDTGAFATSTAKNAPPCSLLKFHSGSAWCKEPFCASGKPSPAAKPGIPHVQAFSEGNGNEHRVSYKGYAAGYAQLIHSPTTWVNNPMIINTAKSLTDDTSPGPIGGPMPTNSQAPKGAVRDDTCCSRLAAVCVSFSRAF